MIIAPLIQLIVFGYVVTTDVRDIRLALVDQSRTPESRQLFDAFDGNKTFRITHAVQDPKELDRLLLKRAVDLAVRIPPDFSTRIRKGETAAVQILADGSMSNMAAVRISYTVSLLEQFNSRMLRELYRRDIRYGEIEGRIRTWYNPNLDSQYFFVPAIVAFLIMLLVLLLTSMAIIREKESGTIKQLIVTPQRYRTLCPLARVCRPGCARGGGVRRSCGAFAQANRLEAGEMGNCRLTADDALQAEKQLETAFAAGLFLFTYHIGEETIHIEEFLGKRIDIEFMFFTTDFISSYLYKNGFEKMETIEREPYPGVGYGSQRAYVIAEKPS